MGRIDARRYRTRLDIRLVSTSFFNRTQHAPDNMDIFFVSFWFEGGFSLGSKLSSIYMI